MRRRPGATTFAAIRQQYLAQGTPQARQGGARKRASEAVAKDDDTQLVGELEALEAREQALLLEKEARDAGKKAAAERDWNLLVGMSSSEFEDYQRRSSAVAEALKEEAAAKRDVM